MSNLKGNFAQWAIAALLLSLLFGCNRPPQAEPAAVTKPAPTLMTPPEFQALPSQPADQRIAYGKDANQFGELRLPATKGPHPLVILIHGGCWRAEFATLRDLAPMGDALKAQGIASWNVEYRRLWQPGSGWPGTYLDIAQAVDFVHTLAARHPLDLQRVIVLGHSAGGHLAMWAAARHRLPRTSPLYVANPLPLRGVLNLAGTPDLAGYVTLTDKNHCDNGVIEGLLGGQPDAQREREAQVSALKLLPLGVPQVLVWGRLDDFLNVSVAEAYVRAAQQAGDAARLIVSEDTGHFETASPLASTWPQVQQSIQSLLEGKW